MGGEPGAPSEFEERKSERAPAPPTPPLSPPTPPTPRRRPNVKLFYRDARNSDRAGGRDIENPRIGQNTGRSHALIRAIRAVF